MRLALLLILMAGTLHAQQPEQPQRVIDWKYLAINGAHAAMAFGDVALTEHCIHLGTCYEGNPLLPTSSNGKYALAGAGVAAGAVMSYEMRKAGVKAWYITPVIGLAAHTVGFAFGARF